MRISFVRGAYLNNFEGQNYAMPITAYSSLFPIDERVPFPLVKLPSIADLQRIPLLNLPIKYIANRTLGDSQILFGLERHIIGSDIVHIADPHYYYALQAGRLREKGMIKHLVSTWWETIPFNNESTRAKRELKKFVMKQVDIFVCYTRKAHACLLAEGVDERRIREIALGVSLGHFLHTSGVCKAGLTILFVGRLVEEKGIFDLLEAFMNIRSLHKDICLTIIGTGPLKGKISRYIENNHLQNNVSIGEKNYRDMPKTFQEADVLCVPSKHTKTWEEQLGMVFIEALASGLPIVSYDTGSIREVVGEAGIIVPENDVQGIARALTKLIESSELRRKIGTMGRERAKRLFDAEKTSRTLNSLYKSL